jgi:hypothetical protein
MEKLQSGVDHVLLGFIHPWHVITITYVLISTKA